jgi:monothiol glutaredoxin
MRQTAFAAARPTALSTPAPATSFLLSLCSQRRLLSDAVRRAIDKAVASAPVVLFMKGTPETPQCGFSRASIQVLGLQGVDPNKFAAFNVLEDQELRQGKSTFLFALPGKCSVMGFKVFWGGNVVDWWC